MIDTAVVLAAGAGSRLRAVEPYKPLCKVAGTPLLAHALHGLHAAGIGRAVIITGFGADAIEQFVAAGDWPLETLTVRNPDWQQPNGVSVLAAEQVVGASPFLLAMSDHLVDPALYARVRAAGAGPGLRLGIDRTLGSDLVDEEDVTRVRTEGAKIAAIGKLFEPYDAYDVGVFAIAPTFFDALRPLTAPSITDGVRKLIELGRAETVDCTGLVWVDVDDPAALEKAEARHPVR